MPHTCTPNKPCPIIKLNTTVMPVMAKKQNYSCNVTLQEKRWEREGDVKLLHFMSVSVKNALIHYFYKSTLNLRKDRIDSNNL